MEIGKYTELTNNEYTTKHLWGTMKIVLLEEKLQHEINLQEKNTKY